MTMHLVSKDKWVACGDLRAVASTAVPKYVTCGRCKRVMKATK